MTTNTDLHKTKAFHSNYEPLLQLTEGVLHAASHWTYNQLKVAEKNLIFPSCVAEEQSLFSGLLDKMYSQASPGKRLPLVEFQFPPPSDTLPLGVLVPVAPPPLRDDDIPLLPVTGSVEEPHPQCTPVRTAVTSVLTPRKKTYLGHSHFSLDSLVALQAELQITDTELQLAGKTSATARKKAITDWATRTGNIETTKKAVALIKKRQTQAVPQPQPRKRKPSSSQAAPIPKESATEPLPKRP
ncbi:hypothetical protein Pelo_6180 [Pelomyxa schiedti]|nr:hypothetical protein Pelo_6180 [Pelomyxa schiedti]